MKTSSRVIGLIATSIASAECLFWLGTDDRAAGMPALAATGGALAFAIGRRRPGLASALLAGAALVTFVSESFSTLLAGPLFVVAASLQLLTRRGAASIEGRKVTREQVRTETAHSPLVGNDPARGRTALVLGAIASVLGVLEFVLLLFAGTIAAGLGVTEGIALPVMLFIVLVTSLVGAIGAALVQDRPRLAGGMLVVASVGLFGGLVSAPLFLLAGIIALTARRPRLTARTP